MQDLERAARDPAIADSPEHAELLGIVVEVLSDAVLPTNAETAFDVLYRALSVRGGGAPRSVDHDEVRRIHARFLETVGARGAVSATATRVGLSTRQTRAIVKKSP